jgi:3',5'-cyclic AMP phosphodiesterase CpdA
MPVIVHPTRRQLLRFAGTGAALAGLKLAGSQEARLSRWALVSDTHISAERDEQVRQFVPYQNLEKAVPRIMAAKPDGCVITGDLARLQGTPADYVQLKSLVKPLTESLPVGFCLGNHDDRDNFLRAFSTSAGEPQALKQKHVAVIQRAPVRMILLDSLIVPNETPGFLGKAQRTWLDKYLETTDATPVLLFVHHTLDDEDGSLLDSDRLLRLAVKHQKVKAIFYGHSHRYSYDVYEGVHLVNLPALGYHFNEKQPVGWVEASFHPTGVELTLRAIAGNTAEDGMSRRLSWRA